MWVVDVRQFSLRLRARVLHVHKSQRVGRPRLQRAVSLSAAEQFGMFLMSRKKIGDVAGRVYDEV